MLRTHCKPKEAVTKIMCNLPLHMDHSWVKDKSKWEENKHAYLITVIEHEFEVRERG